MNGSKMPSYAWVRYHLGYIRLSMLPASRREDEIRKIAATAKESSNPDDRLRGLLLCTDWACEFQYTAPDREGWAAFHRELLASYNEEMCSQNR
jgi:hypothetical protein